MFEQGSVMPIQWSVALEEADRGLKDKLDAKKSEIKLWEMSGIHIGPT